jgi:hypothetical protein
VARRQAARRLPPRSLRHWRLLVRTAEVIAIRIGWPPKSRN